MASPSSPARLAAARSRRVFRSWRQRFLGVEDARGVLEEGLVRLLLRADTVGRGLEGGGMNIDQRELLEDDARGGKVLDDLVHRGLGHLAVRALQIGELDQHQVLARSAASSSSGLCFEHIPCGGVRSCAEGYKGRPLNDVIAVRGDVHDDGLRLGVGRLADDEDDDLGDVGRIRRLDGHHAPQPVGIIAPYLVEEGVHRLQRGRCGGKVPRICRRQRIGRHGLRNRHGGRGKVRRLRRGSGGRGRWGRLRWAGWRGLRQCHARAQAEDDNESCGRDPTRN